MSLALAANVSREMFAGPELFNLLEALMHALNGKDDNSNEATRRLVQE